MNAEIITTGTEILLGEIVDTNAAWIAQQLRDAGINLFYKTTVGDNESRLREVLATALTRSDVAIVTGGLGPTVDDITREAIAAAVGQPLVLHAPSLEAIRTRFVQFGAPMTPNNERQAFVPQGATVIDNSVGTAPAFHVTAGRTTIFALPGVPREMKHLMTTAVLPYLRERNGHAGVIRRRILRTIGVGESAIDDLLHDLMLQSNPSVGLAAHFGQVDVRITARAATDAEADALLDEAEGHVRARVGRHIYSATPQEPFARFIVDRLIERGATVAVVELGAAGRLAETLRQAQPDAAPVAAGWTETTVHELGLQCDLAGLQITDGDAQALEAARRAQQTAGAAYGLALLMHPGEGDQAGVSYVGLVGPVASATRRLTFGGRDEFSRLRAVNQALILLWHALRGDAE